jgi:hypothetical protein
MVNQKYYLEVLAKLQERLRKKWPELWKKKSLLLHQDNVPAHDALAVKQFLVFLSADDLQHYFEQMKIRMQR